MNRAKQGLYDYLFLVSQSNNSGGVSNNAILVAYTVIVICLAVLFAYIGWSIGRGFDITDEAFYLTSAMHPETIKASTTFHSWLLAPIWTVTGTLVSFRWFGVLLLTVSAPVLAMGAYYCCRQIGITFTSEKAPYVLVISSIIASLLYGSFVYFSPSYNLLASTFTYMTVGLCLFSTRRPLGWTLLSLQILSGILIAFIFLAKFSSAIIVAIVVFTCIFLYAYSTKERVISIVTLSLTFVFTTLCMVLVNSDFEQVQRSMELGIEQRGLGYIRPLGELLAFYFTDYYSYIVTVLSTFSLPFFSLISYTITKQRFFSIFSVISLVVVLITNEHLLGGSTFNIYTSQMVGLVAVVFMVAISTFRTWGKSFDKFFLCCVLFLLPYCVSVGTGNSLVWQVLFALAPWGVLVALFVYSPIESSKVNVLALTFSAIFAVVITSQVVTAGLNNPYHLNKPLTEQNIPVEIGNIGTVLVDEETKVFVDGLAAAVKECDIKPNTPYIGLYNNIGIALALKAKPFFTHWIDTPQQVQFSFEHSEPEITKRAIVGLRHWGNSQGQIILPKALANFANNYRSCGTVTYPFQNQPIGIYQPKLIGE